MGSDGHINISNKEQIKLLLMECMEDAIFNTILPHHIPDEYSEYTVNLTNNNLIIQFYTQDDDVESEQIVVKTVNMDPTHYWAIYIYLVSEFNNSLNINSIPSSAWDKVSPYNNVEDVIDDLQSRNMNYTYWDTDGYWFNTIFSFFDYDDKEAIEQLYNNIIKYDHQKPWYKCFIQLFSSVNDLIEHLINYKHIVTIDSFEMWT